MLDIKKNGRHVLAMIMNEPVNSVLGVVQCAIDGCQAHMAIMTGLDEEPPTEQVQIFLETHDCNPNRFPPSKHHGGRRSVRG